MTASFRDVIQKLRTLQALDLRLARLDREITDGPLAVASYLRAVAAVDAKIAALDERVKLLKAQAKLRENEAKTAEGKVERLNTQASEVKTNREFQALRSEIANAKLEVSKQEDEILKIMEAVEAQDKLIAVAREERAREQKRYDAEKVKVDAAIDGLRASRAELAKERPPLLVDVPKEALSIYERVAKARGDAVVPLEQDFCSGCMERLTKNDVVTILNASRLVQCKSCSRILYADKV